MKTWKKRWIALGLALVLAAGWLWSSWPRSLETLFPGFAWAEVTAVGGSYDRYEADPNPEALPGSLLSWHGTAGPLDAGEAQALLKLYQGARFRRSVPRTVAGSLRGGQAKEMTDGSVSAHFSFSTPEGYLFLDLYRDEAEITYVTFENGPGLSLRGSFSNGYDLAGETLAFFRAHAQEVEY